MKYIVVVLMLICCSLKAQTKAFSHKFEVRTDDCSGVGITPIEGTTLASQHKVRPFAHQTIYMYKKGKCVDSLVTDSAGWVKRRIKSGKYDLFLSYKHKRTVPIKTEKEFDMECMKKEWAQPDGMLDISWKGIHFVNKRIGYKFCDWKYNCLKERHIPAGSQG